MKIENDKYAIIGTAVFHIILVVLFLYLGLSVPFPPPPEKGVEVNLGMSDVGMGKIQPDRPIDPTPSDPTPVPETQETEDATEHNTGEGPKIEEKKEKKKTKPDPEPDPEPEPEPEPEVNQQSMYKAPTKTNTDGGTEGKTGAPGDQGNPFGSKTSNNYNGGGSGNGISFSLGGREKLHIPEPDKTFSEEGTVKVTIYVNQHGIVTRAIPGARGTVASAHLEELAKKAAMKAKFKPDPSAGIEQKGTITYHFILKN